MQKKPIWLDILFLAAAIAFMLALSMATLGAAPGAAKDGFARQQEMPSTSQQSFEGFVTCSRCDARHSAALGRTAADCARMCVRGGANFALVEKDTTYILDGDLGVLGRLAGQRARIVGALNGKTIRISSASAES